MCARTAERPCHARSAYLGAWVARPAKTAVPQRRGSPESSATYGRRRSVQRPPRPTPACTPAGWSPCTLPRGRRPSARAGGAMHGGKFHLKRLVERSFRYSRRKRNNFRTRVSRETRRVSWPLRATGGFQNGTCDVVKPPSPGTLAVDHASGALSISPNESDRRSRATARWAV
ncbi:MAG: hypothetical protein ACI81R_001684 [Bradymonadia bacterium]|jgi:hypothetical protein